MVDATRSQTTLDNLEATTLTQNHVANRNSDVGECDVAMSVGGIIVAVDLEHSLDLDTGGSSRYEDDRLLPVDVLVGGIRLAHDDVDLASWVAGTARPPLGSVQDVLVALSLDIELDVGRIGAGNVGLRHEERRADLALHERLEPLRLLRSVAVLGQDLHVAGVRGGAIARLGGRSGAAEPLSHQAILEVGPAGRLGVVALGEEHVPETELAGLDLEVLDDGGVALPASVANANLSFKNGIGS